MAQSEWAINFMKGLKPVEAKPAIVPHTTPSDVPDDLPANVAAFKRYLAAEVKAGRIAHSGVDGDATLLRIACQGRDYQITEEIARDLIFSDFNPHCQPPWETIEFDTSNGGDPIHRAYTGAAQNKEPGRDAMPRGEDVFREIVKTATKLDKPADVVDDNEDSAETQFDGLEPDNILGDDVIEEPVFDPATMLPPSLTTYVVDTAESLGVVPEQIAMPVLVACSTVLHGKHTLQMKDKDTRFKARPGLQIAMIGDPGSRKSPAMHGAFEPVLAIQTEWIAEYRKKFSQYEDRQRAWVKDGMKGPAPEKPVHPVLVLNSLTFEGLRDVLVGNPRGLTIFAEELDGYWQSFGQYKSGGGDDRQIANGLFDGKEQSFLRAKSGMTVVPFWGANILGGIQPGILKTVAPKMTDDGMLQRMLPVYCGMANDGHEADEAEDEEAKQQYATIIRRLVALEPATMPMRLSGGAQKVRAELEEFIRVSKSDPTISTAHRTHIDKWGMMFGRMLLLYHAITNVAAASIRTLPYEVSEATAMRVSDLFFRFFRPSTNRFYREHFQSVSAPQDHGTRIARYLLTHPHLTKITAKQIREVYRPAKRDEGIIMPAMAFLAGHTWVAKPEYRGAAPWWAINPAIHTKFSETAKIEKAALVERKKKMQVDFAARAVLKAVHKNAPVIPAEPTPRIPAEIEAGPGAGENVPDTDPKEW